MNWRVFLLLLCATQGHAADLHADGAIDTRFGLTRKLDVVLHNRARVVAKNNEWYDVSFVPIVRYAVTPSLRIYGGSFFTWFDFPGKGWTNVYRPMCGVEPSFKREKFTISSRTGYERFMPAGNLGDFNRYRQRFRIQGNSGWTPYANIEFFATNEGYSTTRYGTGIRRNLGPSNGIEFSYWYETNKLAGSGVRHMLALTYHFQFEGLAPDF